MKKSLSVLLSVAMSVSIFSSVAFGAEGDLDTKAKYDALVQSGIFDGMGDGLPHLEDPMTRAQLAKILTKLKNLQEVSGSSYTDLDGAGWASGYIEAVTKAGLMDGVDVGIFAPSSNVTLEQLATVLVRALNLPVPANPWVSGEVSDWAKGYVAAALQAGLIAPKSDFTKQAARADLVDSTYSAKQQIDAQNEATATFSVDGAKALKVAFSKAVDSSKVTFDVKYGSADAKPAKVTWSSDKKAATLEYNVKLQPGEYTITAKGAASKDLSGKVSVEEEKVAKIEIASDTAPAKRDDNYQIKTVQVHYKVLNQYNEDITKTTTVVWNSSFGPMTNDDTQQGIVEFTIPDGNSYYYTVGSQFTVNGYISGTNVNVNKTMKIGEESRASTVEVKQLWSADGKPLSVTLGDYSGYYLLLDVKDQYGNPVKAKALDGKDGQLFVQSSNPTLLNVVDENNDPHFFDNVGPNSDQLGLQLVKPANQNYITGDTKVTITFNPKFGGTSTSYEVELKKGSIVQNFSMSSPTVTVSRGDTVTIPYTATDEEGNAITDIDYLAYEYNDKRNNNGINLTSNLSSGAVRWEKDESTNKAVIKLTVDENAPDMIYINAFVQSTAKNVQLTIPVKEAKYPAAIVGWKTNAHFKPALAVDKENTTVHSKATVRLEGEYIVVQDQYGNEMAMNDGQFFKDYAIRVQLASPTDKIKIVGHDKDYTFFDTKTDSVYDDVYYLTTKDAYIDIEGQDVGTANLKLDIVYNGSRTTKKDKDGNYYGFDNVVITNQYGSTKDYTKISVKELPLQVVNLRDINSFEIASIAKIYDNYYSPKVKDSNGKDVPLYNADGKDINIYGKLSSGTQVKLSNDKVILSASEGLSIDKKYPNANQVVSSQKKGDPTTGVPFTGDENDTKGKVTANILKSNGDVTISKEFDVSRATPVLTQINTGDDVPKSKNEHNFAKYNHKFVNGVLYVKPDQINNKKIADGLLKKFDFKDQYGITQNSAFKPRAKVVLSQVEGFELSASEISAEEVFPATVEEGDKFSMVVVGHNGVTKSVKVVVTNTPDNYK